MKINTYTLKKLAFIILLSVASMNSFASTGDARIITPDFDLFSGPSVVSEGASSTLVNTDDSCRKRSR